MHVRCGDAAALAMFLMHVGVTDGFALAPLGSAGLCSQRWASSRGPRMQEQEWIEAAVTSQGRGPVGGVRVVTVGVTVGHSGAGVKSRSDAQARLPNNRCSAQLP